MLLTWGYYESKHELYINNQKKPSEMNDKTERCKFILYQIS